MKITKNDPRLQYILVLGASAVVLILGFLTNIITTHAMATEEYGYYRAFVNGITTLTTLTSFGVSLTVAREFATKNELQQKKELSGAAYIIYFVITLATFAVLLVAHLVAKLFGAEIPSYLLLAAASVWLMLLTRFYLFRFQGENDMLRYALLNVIPQCLLTLTFLVFFLMGIPMAREAAILAYFVSYASMLLFFFLGERPSFKNLRASVKELLVANRNYGFQLYVGGLASVASAQVLNLLVASLSGLEEYAFFSLGVSLASPIMQVPAVMGTISFRKNVNRERIPKKQMIVTLSITALAAVGYSLFLKYVICFLIGDEYLAAIPYAMIMMYYYIFMGFGDFFHRFVSAKGYGKDIRNNAFVVGICLVASAAVLVPLFGVTGVILAETISGLVYLLAMFLRYKKILRIEKQKERTL